MEYYIETLVIELTRKCNMQCPHCLRGCSENIETTFEIAKTAIDKFNYIGSITFSGGEPTLASKTFKKIVDYIISNKKNVNGFYIASNGLTINHDFMADCCRLYAYIFDMNKGYIEDGQCVFDISLDQYHEGIPENNITYLKCFRFVETRGEINEDYVINEGSAYYNGFGMVSMDWSKQFEPNDESDNTKWYDLLYVNAKGNIAPLCDYSYDTQDNIIPQCSILTDDDIETIMKNYNRML